MDRDNLDLAEDYFNRGLAEFQDLNSPDNIAYIEFRLAQVHQKRNNPTLAQTHYTTAHKLYTQLGAAKDLERIEREFSEQ